MEMNMTNLLWFFAFIFLCGGNGFGGLFGGRAPMGPPPVSQQDLTAGLNNQTLQSELNALGIATQNNNYETARLISDQNMMMQNQNNSNLVNIIQGFNSIVQQMQSQTSQISQQLQGQMAQVSQQISQLGYQMDQCCCKIQTQMLENRLADKTAEVVALQNKLDNRDQTQTILNNLGRFVPWAGSGSQAATAAG